MSPLLSPTPPCRADPTGLPVVLPALSSSPPCPPGHHGSGSGPIPPSLPWLEQAGAGRAACPSPGLRRGDGESPAKGTGMAQTHPPSLRDGAGLRHGTHSPWQRDVPVCVRPGTNIGTHECARPDGRTSTTACGVCGGCCHAHCLCAGAEGPSSDCTCPEIKLYFCCTPPSAPGAISHPKRTPASWQEGRNDPV